MINKTEDQRNEFKIKLTDNLENVVISFLNTIHEIQNLCEYLET